METDASQSRLKRIDFSQLELPMLPDVALQVMNLCRQEETDAAALSKVLHRDQVLAGNVLRVANSPVYAPRVPIASLQQAVGRIGLNQVAELAVSLSLRGMMQGDGEHQQLLSDLWRHSVAAGFFAKEIARTRRANVEQAFLCGLLHDVGKALLLANTHKICAGLSGLPESHLVRFLEEYHCEAGRVLVAAWGLPPALCAAIGGHHGTIEADQEHAEVIATTWLADRLAALLVPGESATPEDDLRASELLELLDFYSDDMDDLLARAPDVLAMVEEMTA